MKRILHNQNYQIYGLPLAVFILFALAFFAVSNLGILPSGLLGALPLLIVLGGIFAFIGDKIPFTKSYLGGSTLICIFAGSLLVYFNLLHENSINSINSFMNDFAFLDFYITSLIAGSILGMNKDILIRVSFRYLPALLLSIIFALGFVAITSHLVDFGWLDGILFIGLPILGGGIGATAVPLSTMFSYSMDKDASTILGIMLPAIVLANVLSILSASFIGKLGHKKPHLTGNGQLMKDSDTNFELLKQDKEYLKDKYQITIRKLATGLFVATSFYAIGLLLNHYMSGINTYAWMIMMVALAKISGLLPQSIENCAFQWYEFVMTNLLSVLLVALGIVFIDFSQILESFSLLYLLLIVMTLVGAIVGSIVGAKLVGFHVIESSLATGLCMTNNGGSGDVAVLSAANRIQLMPFAQISSRIGGAFILILASILIQVFV